MLATQQAKEVFLADGTDLVQIVGQGGAIKSAITEKGGVQVFTNLLAADGAIPNRVPGFYMITKGSAAALTLAAPVAGTDDGMEVEITVGTNFAHVITATGLLQQAGAAANKNSITFADATNRVGSTVYLTAFNGLWLVANGGYGTITIA